MDYFIYTLSDPISMEIKYIGKTKNLKDRLQRHMSPCNLKQTWQSKTKWLKYLKNNNLKPVMEQLDIGDENNIDHLEIFWISQFKSWGFKLKNETIGGDGCDWTGKKHTKESIHKMKMNHPLRKTICQYNIETDELIKEYNSSYDASNLTGLQRGHITKCCKGIKSYNSVGGYYFRFKDNYFKYEKPSNWKSKIEQYENGKLIFTYNTTRELKKNGYTLELVKKSIIENITYRSCVWKII